MTLVILPSAREDLAAGSDFYEKQEAEAGVYFLESLFSDIESLKLYAGIHRKVFGYGRAGIKGSGFVNLPAQVAQSIL